MRVKTPTSLSRRALLAGGAIAVAGAGLLLTLCTRARAETPLTDLLARTHIHGLAVDGQDSGRLLIATHNGVACAGSGHGPDRPHIEPQG